MLNHIVIYGCVGGTDFGEKSTVCAEKEFQSGSTIVMEEFNKRYTEYIFV